MDYRESTPLAASPSESSGNGRGIKKARRAIRRVLKNCGPNSRCGSPSGPLARVKRVLSGVGTGINKPMKNKASRKYKIR